MLIYLNDQAKEIPENSTVAELIKLSGYVKGVVIWVNGDKLLQKEVPNFILKNQDQVKVIRILGGG